jgi:hypothetical protein
MLVADGGVENFNGVVDKLIASASGLLRLRSQFGLPLETQK